MVLKKRLEYRFHGFQVPTIPRAPRSARVSIGLHLFFFLVCLVISFILEMDFDLLNE